MLYQAAVFVHLLAAITWLDGMVFSGGRFFPS